MEGNESSFQNFRSADRSSLARAQLNVEQHYSVVGVLEDLRNFFRATEKICPTIFEGASSVYKGEDRVRLSRKSQVRSCAQHARLYLQDSFSVKKAGA